MFQLVPSGVFAAPLRRLGADREVNGLVGAAFQQVPSFKFLPLVYQVASRLSAGAPGSLPASVGCQQYRSAVVAAAARAIVHMLACL